MSKKTNNANRVKHLEFIQNVIERMAFTSLMLKTLATCITGLLVACSRPMACLIPLIVFWPLDSFYLSQERRYRFLYNLVRMDSRCVDDFAMHVILPKETGWPHSCEFFACLKSRTLAGFYIALATVCYLTVL